jgi:hypothetical protein
VIERDKAIKVEELREEIARKQEIIEKNDELNETKNMQIFKQVRHLKEENINLTNEKEILFEDFQKTEQAFNEEVALRLKFENKIKELFGLHRELAIKHQRLYEDYKKRVLECAVATQKAAQLNSENSEMKIQITELQTDKQQLISSDKFHKELLEIATLEKQKLNEEHNLTRHQYDDERRINK